MIKKIILILLIFCSFIAINTFANQSMPIEKNLKLTFPKDHGAHPNYQVEWWYFTGHLIDENNRTFGFELTFFWTGKNSEKILIPKNWNMDSFFIAHFTISDDRNKKFYYHEKISRNNFNIAGAKKDFLETWNGNWHAVMDKNIIKLFAKTKNSEISLVLKPGKPVALNGKNGFAKKGSEENSFSYYYSLSRLLGSGEIKLDNNIYKIKNASVWMDHEFMPAGGKKKWNWFALQLSNNEEIMVVYFGDKSFPPDPYNAGTLITQKGQSIYLKKEDFSFSVLDYWKSDKTGKTYPSKWLLKIPKYGYELVISPTFSEQELNTSLGIYWEGRCTVQGKWHEKPIIGNAYVEMADITK